MRVEKGRKREKERGKGEKESRLVTALEISLRLSLSPCLGPVEIFVSKSGQGGEKKLEYWRKRILEGKKIVTELGLGDNLPFRIFSPSVKEVFCRFSVPTDNNGLVLALSREIDLSFEIVPNCPSMVYSIGR